MRADLVSSLVHLVNPKTQHYTLLVMFCANLFFFFFMGEVMRTSTSLLLIIQPMVNFRQYTSLVFILLIVKQLITVGQLSTQYTMTTAAAFVVILHVFLIN